MASCASVTGKPVPVPKPPWPASCLMTPPAPARCAPSPPASPFPTPCLPARSFFGLGDSFDPTSSPKTSQSPAGLAQHPQQPPSQAPCSVLLQTPSLRRGHECLCVFVGSVTLFLQPPGSWRAGTCLTILVSTPRPSTGWALPGMAQAHWVSQDGEALPPVGASLRVEYEKGFENTRFTPQCQPGPPGRGRPGTSPLHP